jgi:hypothetical protein
VPAETLKAVFDHLRRAPGPERRLAETLADFARQHATEHGPANTAAGLRPKRPSLAH